jgi:hypothetical protein
MAGAMTLGGTVEMVLSQIKSLGGLRDYRCSSIDRRIPSCRPSASRQSLHSLRGSVNVLFMAFRYCMRRKWPDRVRCRVCNGEWQTADLLLPTNCSNPCACRPLPHRSSAGAILRSRHSTVVLLPHLLPRSILTTRRCEALSRG